ncbi:hypothetical protein HDU79_011767 [Rhizoclosmatium sp. JEL0117]|nr:hypothetical protein HDU79_011767 [Rhizoclosmatium sp. JEL0117]
MGTKQKQPAKKLPANIRKRWKARASEQAEEEAKWDELEITELLEEDETDAKKKAKPSQMYRSVLKAKAGSGVVKPALEKPIKTNQPISTISQTKPKLKGSKKQQ